MKKITTILAIGMLPLLVQGCSGTTGSSNAVAPQDGSQPKTTEQNAAQTSAQTPPAQGNTPITPVAVNTTSTNPANTAGTQFSGLIASTNSEQRVQGVVKGRNDPFALFSVQGKLKKVEDKNQSSTAVKEEKKAQKQAVTTNKAVNPKKVATPTATNNNQPKKVTNTPTSQSKPAKPTITNNNPATKKPVILAPDIAKAIEVTGIIDIDGGAIAIIKSPSDASSQYVRAGQFIANGKVLVKSVEAFPEPKVILEQVGIKGQVVKNVQEPTPVAKNNTPAASYLSVEMQPLAGQ